jgi:P-type E1-E2 ATPase
VQAAKYIIELALIVLIVQFILLKEWLSLNYSTKLITLRFLDTIVWSIPPSLPIFFSICKTASLVRLGTKGIMGSNADKVECAGRIDTCCFDKTGTLTTLGLKALKHFTADELQEPMANIIMACCHHLVKINEEITGDPLEVEMFNHVKWQIDFEDKGHFSVTDGK